MQSIRTTRILFFAAASLAVGCGGDDEVMDVALTFQASVAGAPVACTGDYARVGSSAMNAKLADARIFISQIELYSDEWVGLDLVQDSPWQHENVALLDFENGAGSCSDSGTSEVNTLVVGSLPGGEYSALRFQVGVPFGLNHVDSATAPAPLYVPGMFWTWQYGYKFVRVDWMVSDGTESRWNIHVGSTGCTSDAPTEAPAEPCSRTNRVSVELDSFDIASDVVTIDFAALVANADLGQNTVDTPPGCMAVPGEADDCAGVFSALALDFESGQCVDGCAAQAVFRAETR